MLKSEDVTGRIIGIESSVLLPRSIDVATIKKLLQNIEIITSPFVEGKSIIGYVECSEEAICTYSVLQKKSIVESVLSKNVKSTPDDKKQIKHASTELLYVEKTSQALIKYENIVNHIQDKRGTPDEAVVLCCMTRTNNPVSYEVVNNGPLDIKAAKQHGARDSKSCDLMCFGPVYTSLHADISYSHRNSLIPSWNRGVVKFWIIHKKCDAETNRKVPTPEKQRCAKRFQPIHDLTKVLTASKDFVLLIQLPGQLIRHNGRHVHCVITAIDPNLNPTGFSLSIGRKDLYLKDIHAYATGSRDTSISHKCKQASRSLFINTQLKPKDKKDLGDEYAKKEQLRLQGRKRKHPGFHRGNTAAKKKKNTECAEENNDEGAKEHSDTMDKNC